jgi:hypothetical protein
MYRSLAKAVTRRAGSRVACGPRAGFSGLAEKERGDEARFFARDDAEKLAAMKTKFEAVVAKGDAEELDELMDVLGKWRSALLSGFYVLHSFGL